MAFLEKETLSPSVSIKGIIYSALLLLLVISLFFIPNIVAIQEKFTKAKKTKETVSSVASNPSQVNIDDIIQSSKSNSSLSGVLSLINGSSSSSHGLDSIHNKGESLELPSLSFNSQEKNALERALFSNQINWDTLTSNQVRNSLRDAQTGAAKILKGLPARNISVRFALINYINGLSWISRADKKLMTADEALAYLEQLDINVTQAMVTSEIDAGDFEAWKKISFGSVSGRSRAAAFKASQTVSFNPKLTITNVELSKSPDYVKSGAGWILNKRPASSISIVGFVLGKDTKKIIVYRYSKRIADIRVSSRTDEDGLRVFKWQSNDATGIISFRAVSKTGIAFQKSYAFLPKSYRRFNQDQAGYFIYPFMMSDNEIISLDGIDTRIDRFFRVGKSVSDGRSNSHEGFDTF